MKNQLTHELCTMVDVPIFYGLCYLRKVVVLAAYFSRDDAMSYAYNVCQFSTEQMNDGTVWVRRIKEAS